MLTFVLQHEQDSTFLGGHVDPTLTALLAYCDQTARQRRRRANAKLALQLTVLGLAAAFVARR